MASPPKPIFRTEPPPNQHAAVAALPVRFLFSGEFRFVLPWFQRAYAWTPAQIAALASGIGEAMKSRDDHGSYPLGTLILARSPGAHDTALVDGHQRIMTLTILFAVLRDLETDASHAAALDALVADPGMTPRESNYRLRALADVAGLLAERVQIPGSTAIGCEVDWADLSMSERHIVENRDWLRSELMRLLPTVDERRVFARFLLDKCWVVVHIAEDEDEAWRRLRLDEDTRLGFDAESRAKASLLSIVPRGQRQAAADGWAQCERLLAPADLVALLEHLRLLYMPRRRKKRPIEIDVADHYDLRHEGRAFFEGTLLPEARTMRSLISADIGCPAAKQPLACLGWLDHDLWMPAALLWQARRAFDDDATADFYRRLERLMWMMRIAGIDPTRQERRIGRIIGHIENDRALADGIEIDRELRAKALDALRLPRVGHRPFIAALLRRVSVALGADPGPIDAKAVTLEHLLPRNPKNGSDWLRSLGSKKNVDSHAFRLGNLTFMTEKENQEAGCFDWPIKVEVLKGSAFALSTGLASIEHWDARAINARTERLIAALFAQWQLPVV